MGEVPSQRRIPTETASSAAFYGFRGLVMVPLHIGAMVWAIDAPDWVAASIGLRFAAWGAAIGVLTAGWMLFMRVFAVRAKPLASLGGLALEWFGALVVAAVPVVVIGVPLMLIG